MDGGDRQRRSEAAPYRDVLQRRQPSLEPDDPPGTPGDPPANPPPRGPFTRVRHAASGTRAAPTDLGDVLVDGGTSRAIQTSRRGWPGTPPAARRRVRMTSEEHLVNRGHR